MNAKLAVKNFGCMKNAEVDLRKCNVFVGPPSSGNSYAGLLCIRFKKS